MYLNIYDRNICLSRHKDINRFVTNSGKNYAGWGDVSQNWDWTPIKWDSKGWEETCPVWWTTKAGGSFSNLSLCYALKTFGDEVELRGLLGGVRGRLAGRQQVLLWRRGEAIIIIMLMIGLVWKRRSSGWWGRSAFDKESGEKQGRLAGQWGKAGSV